MALLPPPDISAAYVDEAKRPSKDFYNWVKSLYDFVRGGSLTPPITVTDPAKSGVYTGPYGGSVIGDYDFNPYLINVADGSVADPVTVNAPTVGIIRTEAMSDDDGAGTNAALVVQVNGDGQIDGGPAGGVGQVNALKVTARQAGYGDCVGVFAVGEMANAHNVARTGYGGFFVGTASNSNGAQVALGTGLINQTGNDEVFGPTSPLSCALDAVAQEGNDCAAAVQIRVGSSRFDVGIGIQPGSLITSILTNLADSVNGIDLSGASYSGSQIKFNVGSLTNAANDAAASGAGVPVGGIYRNGSILMVRVV